MKIKGIIFDKDGTLFDFQRSWAPLTFDFLKILSDGNSDLLIKLANALHFDLEKKLFNPESIFIAGTTNDTIDVLQPIIPQMTPDDILSAHRYCYANQKQIPVKNLYDVIQNLHEEGLILSIATNDLEKPTMDQLRHAKILHFFSSILGADSGYGSKPGASQLVELKRRNNLLSEEIVMVGDSSHDMLAAQEAGVKSFAVLTGVASRRDLETYTTAVYRDVSCLSAWLKQHNL